eukprot:gene7196-biopygen21020
MGDFAQAEIGEIVLRRRNLVLEYSFRESPAHHSTLTTLFPLEPQDEGYVVEGVPVFLTGLIPKAQRGRRELYLGRPAHA